MNLDKFIQKANELYLEDEWHASAIEYCRVLCIDPGNLPAAENFRLALWRLELGPLLELWCRRVTQLHPYSAALLSRNGRTLSDMGLFRQASQYFEMILCTDPADPTAWVLAASNKLRDHKSKKSQEWASRSSLLSPKNPETELILAASLFRNNFTNDAKEIILNLIREFPLRSEQHYHLGRIYVDEGMVSNASTEFRKAILLNPSDADYFMELSFCEFCLFDFKNAWRHYDHRLRKIGDPSYKEFGDSALRDEKIFDCDQKETALLIWSDEGVGDVIKYGSILKELPQRVTTSVVKLDRRLVPLFRRSFSDSFIFYDSDLMTADDQCNERIAFGSLGRYLRPSLASFFGITTEQYLWADAARVSEMRSLLNKRPGEWVIGLSWRSRDRYSGEARTIQLLELVKNLNKDGVRFVSLQYGNVEAEIKNVQQALGVAVWQCEGLDTTNDIDGLAALIEACDEVVSIGNTTAHLSGALGKKTTVLLTRSPSWRWLACNGYSLWYPSTRVRSWVP